MKHSIIKDFKSWNAIFEALPALGAGETYLEADGKVMAIKKADGSLVAVNPPEAKPAAASGTSSASSQAGATPNIETLKAIAMPTQIVSADGSLTPADIQNVQRLLIKGGFLAPTQTNGKPSDDGNVGPMTKAAIDKIRAALNVTDTSPVSAKSLGQATLAALNQKIQSAASMPELLLPTGYSNAATSAQFTLTVENNDNIVLQACAALIALFDFKNKYKGGVKVPNSYSPPSGTGNPPAKGSMTTALSYFAPWMGMFNDDEEGAAAGGLEPYWNEVITPILKQLPPGNPNLAIFDSALAQQMAPDGWDKWLPTRFFQMPNNGVYTVVPKETPNPPGISGQDGVSFIDGAQDGEDLKRTLIRKFLGNTGNDTLSWGVLLSTSSGAAEAGTQIAQNNAAALAGGPIQGAIANALLTGVSTSQYFSIDTDFESDPNAINEPTIVSQLVPSMTQSFASLGQPAAQTVAATNTTGTPTATAPKPA